MMAGSYKRIDYRVRPAKSIERRMIVEIMRKFAEFGEISAYRYIGFGSLYFSDFTLFHKLLGFNNMVSIENAEHPVTKNRFNFNIPYRHVQMEYGLSTNILSKLEWHERTVLWLDYDGTISRTVLSDIQIFCSHAKSGSAFFVTVNAEPPVYKNDVGADLKNLDALREYIAPEMISKSIKASDFSGTKTAGIYRQIILDHIDDTLRKINATRPPNSKLIYKQLINMHYKDNTRMLTVGGILFDSDQQSNFDRCAFEKLPFVSYTEIPYSIEPPLLTFKELRRIDSLIPIKEEDYDSLPISRSDIEKYVKVYRYYPNFVEAEV